MKAPVYYVINEKRQVFDRIYLEDWIARKRNNQETPDCPNTREDISAVVIKPCDITIALQNELAFIFDKNNELKSIEALRQQCPGRLRRLIDSYFLSKIDENGSELLNLCWPHINRFIKLSTEHESNGWVPLTWACKYDHLELSTMFLLAGANPNGQDMQGNSMLHLISAMKHTLPLIQILLIMGANPNLPNDAGVTPLQIYSQNNAFAAAFMRLALQDKPVYCLSLVTSADFVNSEMLKRKIIQNNGIAIIKTGEKFKVAYQKNGEYKEKFIAPSENSAYLNSVFCGKEVDFKNINDIANNMVDACSSYNGIDMTAIDIDNIELENSDLKGARFNKSLLLDAKSLLGVKIDKNTLHQNGFNQNDILVLKNKLVVDYERMINGINDFSELLTVMDAIRLDPEHALKIKRNSATNYGNTNSLTDIIRVGQAKLLMLAHEPSFVFDEKNRATLVELFHVNLLAGPGSRPNLFPQYFAPEEAKNPLAFILSKAAEVSPQNAK
jgi:hypothetical protein